MSIKISHALRREILEHAETGYPEEVCGVLLGSDNGSEREIQEVRQLQNTDTDDKMNGYQFDSLILGKLEKEADTRGLLLIGFYHSHPDYPAIPSGIDLDHAWMYYSYMIIAVADGAGEKMTSWRFSESTQEFSEEEVIIT